MKNIKFKFVALSILITFGLATTSCVDDDFGTPQAGPQDPVEIDGTILSIDAVLGEIAQNDGDVTTLSFVENTYVEGYVVSSDEGGNFFKELWIQDKPENPTAAIRIAIDISSMFGTYNVGRRIYVKLDGLSVGLDSGNPSIGIANGDRINRLPAPQAEDAIIRDTVIKEIVAKEVNMGSINRGLIGQFIKFQSAQFPASSIEDELTFAAEPFDEFDAEKTMESCSSNATIQVGTSTFSDFKAVRLPSGAGEISGVLLRSFNDEGYLFKINSVEDINFDQDRCDPLLFSCGLADTDAANTLIDVDFENQTINTPVNISGWTNYIEAGSQPWEAYVDNGQNESLGISARVGSFQSDDDSTISWLITPEIPIEENSKVTFEFKTSNSFSDSSILQVLFSTNWDGTEDGIADAEWGLIDDAEIVQNSVFFPEWINSGLVDLSCFEGNGHIAFKYSGSGEESSDGTYELDDIVIKVE